MTSIRSWIGCTSGYLKEHKWQNPEGQERSRIEMTANRVQFLGGGRREETRRRRKTRTSHSEE